MNISNVSSAFSGREWIHESTYQLVKKVTIVAAIVFVLILVLWGTSGSIDDIYNAMARGFSEDTQDEVEYEIINRKSTYYDTDNTSDREEDRNEGCGGIGQEECASNITRILNQTNETNTTEDTNETNNETDEEYLCDEGISQDPRYLEGWFGHTKNASEIDTDNDGIVDACDYDLDGDGVFNDVDNCLIDYNPDQHDVDSDGSGDVCDVDSDNDGYADSIDNCPDVYNPDQHDIDDDGIGDVCDNDNDGDGIPDASDNCPSAYNPGQEDGNNNGIGDACDSFDEASLKSDWQLNTEQIALKSPSIGDPEVYVARTAISKDEIAVLINTNDPQSIEVGEYYAQKRNIPNEHVVYVSFDAKPGDPTKMAEETLHDLRATLDTALGEDMQAVVVTWTEPWRVEKKMSVTVALSQGYSCETYDQGVCGPRIDNPFYQHETTYPYTDTGYRLFMMIPGESAQDAKSVIDRGLQAENTFPEGDGYFWRTNDYPRSFRWQDFFNLVEEQHDPVRGLSLFFRADQNGDGNYLQDTDNVLFYMTGKPHIYFYDTNTYLPGSYADHMTSFGGMLTDPQGQMSILRWLEAGAAGSWGTVQEPGASTPKFVNAEIFVPEYFGGRNMIGAIYSSVRVIYQGIAVGDPLTRPWGSKVEEFGINQYTLTTTIIRPDKEYFLVGGDNLNGRFSVIQSGLGLDRSKVERDQFTLTNQYDYYFLVPRDVLQPEY